MANGHGGYRKPANPAPVSGPGSMSQRTDGGPGQPVRDLPNARYGENKDFRADQQGAPMQTQGPDLSQIVPMGADSTRPEEPVTAGIDSGPGMGSTLPPLNQLTPEAAARLKSYLPVLIQLASDPDADPATKQYVRQLRADVG